MTRVLAVDPGEARIGLAVSDPTRTIARPLSVVRHTSRAGDARRIVEIALQQEAEAIIVGVAYGGEGQIGPSAKRGLRLAEAVRQAGFSHVETWDESGSTAEAATFHKPDDLSDAVAAAVILQSYLDARQTT
jgi:putative Holliday junction resolvase